MLERRKQAFEEWFSSYGVLTSQSKYTLALSETRDKLSYYARNPIGGGAQNINISVYPEHSVYEFDDPIRLRNLFDDCTKQNVRDDGAMHTAVGWYAMWLRLKAPDQWKDVEEWPNDNERKKTMKNRGYDYDAVLGQRLSSNGHSANTHIDSAYLAAIRTKPFILLAGISGTGKSRMVRQLARGCCPRYKTGTTDDHPFYNEQKPGNFEIILVRPNWHDSTELMGYESRIGTPEFIIKPFVEFLVKAWMNPDIPFFLCLDEMNLAPVEQYFAEYLSAIESRKAVNGGGRDYFKTDVVVKMGASEAAWDDHGNSVLHNALEKLFAPYKDANDKLDTWASYVREVFTKDGGVSIPQNLVVMGTVNMDETTCSFSRKVLDRAMSFELNDVSDMYAPDKLVGEGDYEFGSIDVAAAKCSLLTGKEAYDSNAAVGGKVLEYLKIVNEALEGKKFKIAYRSRNEIIIYCVERTNGGIVGLRQALDEATNLKILSRIEGDDQTFASFDLKDFRKTIVKGLLAIDNPSVQDSDVEDFLKDEVKVKASPCASKLGHMIDELSHGAGVVSYWE